MCNQIWHCEWSSLWLHHKILKRDPGPGAPRSMMQERWVLLSVRRALCFALHPTSAITFYTACSLIMKDTDASINTKKLRELYRLNGISIRARAMIMHSEGSYHSHAICEVCCTVGMFMWQIYVPNFYMIVVGHGLLCTQPFTLTVPTSVLWTNLKLWKVFWSLIGQFFYKLPWLLVFVTTGVCFECHASFKQQRTLND